MVISIKFNDKWYLPGHHHHMNITLIQIFLNQQHTHNLELKKKNIIKNLEMT